MNGRAPLRALLCLLAAVAAHAALAAQAPADPARPAERERQEQIYRSRGDAVPEGYVVSRSLLSYLHVLPLAFRQALADLDAADRWLDIGAGEGNAILDYRAARYDVLLPARKDRADKAQAVAMSIEDRRTHRWHEAAAGDDRDRITYLAGRRLREYEPAAIGRFRLVSDVMGGFSYTADLARFMRNVLGLLERDGSFFSVLQDVQSEHGRNRPWFPGAPFLTDLVQPDGSPATVCGWLRQIACAETTCQFKPDMSPPIEIYQVRKTCDRVEVPALVPVHFAAGTPPERRFRLTAPLPPGGPEVTTAGSGTAPRPAATGR